jgi:hypothetical protein
MGKRGNEMNLDALVKKGLSPWAPAPGVHHIDAWHEYDIPTAGTFVLADGQAVLFTLVGEPDDRLTVWAYTGADLEPPRLFESTDDLDATINGMFVGRKAVFVLADGLKIWRWSPVEVSSSVLESATEFLRGVRNALADTNDNPGVRFRAELASVEVETTELVDA